MKLDQRRELKSLRLFGSTLAEQKNFLDARLGTHSYVDGDVFSQIMDEVESARELFPFLVPSCDRDAFVSFGGYSARALSMYLGRVLARLRAEIPESDSSPITEERDFSFVRDTGLRRLLDRDYPEIQRAFVAECWKAVIILAGSAIEACLLDLALQNSAAAKTTTAARKAAAEITKWTISELINVGIELGLVPVGAEKLSHSVREYRNLVHPGYEIRSGLGLGREEARIAVEVLNMIQRELSGREASREEEPA